MIDILLVVFGIWAIISGKLPSWLIGGGKYKIEGHGVRFLGIFLLLVFPLRIIIGRLLVLSGNDGFFLITSVDLAVLIVTILIANIVVRRIRRPVETVEPIGMIKEPE
jgi:hypothetical protein